MDVETDVVAESVGEVLAEGFAFERAAMPVDIVHGDFMEAVFGLFGEAHAGLDSGYGGALRAENDIINFALPVRFKTLML